MTFVALNPCSHTHAHNHSVTIAERKGGKKCGKNDSLFIAQYYYCYYFRVICTKLQLIEYLNWEITLIRWWFWNFLIFNLAEDSNEICHFIRRQNFRFIPFVCLLPIMTYVWKYLFCWCFSIGMDGCRRTYFV